MLPPLPDHDAFRRLRRDRARQRPAIEAIARRHGLPAADLAPFAEGTHLVWSAGHTVIKVFVPLWPEDAQVELAMLERLAGTELAVPQLEATGELDGYRYVVMSRLGGRPVGEVWSGLGPDARRAIATQMGERMAALHALSPPPLPCPPLEHDALLAERLQRVLAEQRERGAAASLLAQVSAYLADLPPLPSAEPVLLHADLTADHFLVEGDRVTGLIDFADAFVGPWTYDLAAPAALVTRGDATAWEAMVRGLGREPTPQLSRAVRAWVVLHRYAHLAAMLGPEADLARWLAAVAGEES